MQQNRYLILWLYSGIFLIFSMVVVGGLTRLTNSGLSIVEWNLFSEINPFNLDQQEWNRVFDQYKQTPEFTILNNHFDLTDFKRIFWWEYIHRMLGRFIGIVFIVPYLIFTLKNMISNALHKQLLIILGLGAFQAFLGWFMVESGFVDQPHVNHFRLAAHLTTAFLTCAYIFWVLLGAQFPGRTNRSGSLLHFFHFFSIVFLIQIILGAFVAGLDAGRVFNSFPMMGNDWIAPQVFESNIFYSMAGVQFLHRVNAFVLILFSFFLYKKYSSLLKNKLNVFFVLLAFQVLLGVSTLIYHVPLNLALAHQCMAFVMLLYLIYLKDQLLRN